MPITELIFPAYKPDTDLEAKLSESIKLLENVPAIQSVHKGFVISEDGQKVDALGEKGVVVLEWDHISSFHAFVPNSYEFKAFAASIMPLLAERPIPQLHEAEERALQCVTAPVTQIVQVKGVGVEARNAWAKLEDAIVKAGAEPRFYQGDGIEKEEGTFLGLIGWSATEESEAINKNDNVSTALKALTGLGKSRNVLTRLT